MSTHSEYLAQMSTRLTQWDAELDRLASEGESRRANVRAAYYDRVKLLRANRSIAEKTFSDLQAATESAGEAMRDNAQKAWDSLRRALEKATTDLHKL
ncbi:MAG TPA: hypothetical protein VFK82_06010 [Burkholderiaceae bacterium]|nr:hypothetical protein [Burkholderiaceae bacterium]